jgi:hypothetical protein
MALQNAAAQAGTGGSVSTSGAVLGLLHGQLDRELTPPRIGCPKTEGVEGIPLGKPMAGVDNQPTEYLTRVFE